MTSKDIVIRFVNSSYSIFGIEDIMACTGFSRRVIKRILNELVAEKCVRQISKRDPIYVKDDDYLTRVSTIHSINWIYSIEDCKTLMWALDGKYIKSIRALAAKIGKSRQWVFKYLEALISVEAIGIRKAGYYVTCYENMYKVGSVIKKGIIRELRAECGIKPNRRKSATTKTPAKLPVKAPAKRREQQKRPIGHIAQTV